MKNKLLIALILLVVAAQLQAQGRFRIEMRGSWNTFAMGGVHDMQDGLAAEGLDSNIPLKVVDDMPAWWGTELLIGNEVNVGISLIVGVHAAFTSTGGRLHYEDYSGYFQQDLKVNMMAYGWYAEMALLEQSRFSLRGRVKAGLIKSKGNINVKLMLEKTLDEVDVDLESSDYYTEFEIIPTLNLGSNMTLGLALAYQLTTSNALKAGDGGSKFYYNTETIKLDWSGLRMGLCLSQAF